MIVAIRRLRSLGLGLCFSVAAGVAPALADPPQLNLLDGEPGETEIEASGYVAVQGRHDGPGFFYSAEVSHAVSDRFGLELQLTGSRQDDRFEDEALSLQAYFKTADLAAGGSLGLSVEAAIEAGGQTALGAMVYGVVPAGPWRTAFNLGAETQGSDASEAVYAWRMERPAGDRWTIGATGGGSEPLRGDEAAEHYAGPAISWRLGSSQDAGSLGLGLLFGLTKESPTLLQVGLNRAF